MNSLEVLVSVSFGHLWVPHGLRDFMREKLAPGRSRRLAFYSHSPYSQFPAAVSRRKNVAHGASGGVTK